MILVALDLNNDRLWGVAGRAKSEYRLIHMDGERAELPLALSLARRRIEVGGEAKGLSRRRPHLVCEHFLSQLGNSREWRHGRHCLNAEQALGRVFAKVGKHGPSDAAWQVAVPVYLSREQGMHIGRLAKGAGLRVTALVQRPLAAASATYAEQSWHNVGLFVDVDDHAMTISVCRPNDKEMRTLHQRIAPELGTRIWKEKLLDAMADACIRQNRRDLRESADVEQEAYNQLPQVLERCSRNEPATVRLHTTGWGHDLTVSPLQAAKACAALSERAARETVDALRWAEEQLSSATIYLTAGAGRLPGLAAALYASGQSKTPVVVLPADAVVRGAYELGQRIQAGEIPPGWFDAVVPLPPVAANEKPQVLSYRGKKAQVGS